MSVNKLIIVGRVGKEPEVKEFEDKKKASFSVATSRNYLDKSGEKQEKTSWHNIAVWGKVVDYVQKNVKKGDLLYVEGSSENSSYEDRNGEVKYFHELVASSVQKLQNGKNHDS